jgi:hypothetical protein
MRVLPAAPAGVTLLVAAGCAGTTETAGPVHDVTPVEAYNDIAVPFTIHGGPFRPAYDIDTTTGKTTLSLDAFHAILRPSTVPGGAVTIDGLAWQASNQLAGSVGAGAPMGFYDLELHDPRGNVVVRPQAFQSLGADHDPPVLTIFSPGPGSFVAANTTVPVMFHADDGAGHLASVVWSVGPPDDLGAPQPCPPLIVGDPHVDCPGAFTAPTPAGLVQPLRLSATATDSAGNSQTQVVDFWVALAPVVTSFSPGTGPSNGMTTLTVQGDNFVQGGTQILVDGAPVLTDGGDVQSVNVISGLTPAHDPGTVPVVVRTGGAEVPVGQFVYVAPPRVRIIDPSAGPAAGGTMVTIAGDHFRDGQTQIYFGRTSLTTRLACLTVVSPQRIVGFTPAGTGKVTVFADDPVGGSVGTGADFTYVTPRDAGADAAAPADLDAGAPAGCEVGP